MPHPTVRCAVRHPVTGSMIALDPSVDYASDDPFVKQYPWAFAPVENSHERVESVEVAQAEPGQKRTRSRK
jgi:hypothetical protein